MGLLGDFFSRGFDDNEKADFKRSLENYEKEMEKKPKYYVAFCKNCGIIKKEMASSFKTESESNANLVQSFNREKDCIHDLVFSVEYW